MWLYAKQANENRKRGQLAQVSVTPSNAHILLEKSHFASPAKKKKAILQLFITNQILSQRLNHRTRVLRNLGCPDSGALFFCFFVLGRNEVELMINPI